jgi:hypothetical protein
MMNQNEVKSIRNELITRRKKCLDFRILSNIRIMESNIVMLNNILGYREFNFRIQH